MDTSLFDFDLPKKLVAMHPVIPRDNARLLVARQAVATINHSKKSTTALQENCVQTELELIDDNIRALPQILNHNDILIFNDTRVIPAYLNGIRLRDGNEAKVQINLYERLSSIVWRSFAKPLKRLNTGDTIRFADDFVAEVITKNPVGNYVDLKFNCSADDFDALLTRYGSLPLPPYITSRRQVEQSDCDNYQTVYAAKDGSVAAPTAGLHFSRELLEKLAAVGIDHAFVTLHVGAGTFLPVKSSDTKDHNMHCEWGSINHETVNRINAAKARGGRVIAVGTTTLRLLETAASTDSRLKPFSGNTDIFITPGYKFRIIDLLLTNFHLPRSTLFMLVAAFCGLKNAHAIYRHAINSNYRFYSYGDTSLLWRNDCER